MARRRRRRIPGLLHMYIHTMEMSPYPGAGAAGGRPAARPGARRRPPAAHADAHRRAVRPLPRRGHLATSAAIVADRKFLEREGAAQLLHALPLPRLPLQDLRRDVPGPARSRRWRRPTSWRATLPEELLRIEVPPMADWARGRSCRCGCTCSCASGCGSEIIDEPLPDDPRALLRHHGDAALRQGRRPRGHRRRRPRPTSSARLFREAVARVPDTRYLFNNTCLDILAVAAEMLDGEIEYRQRRLRRGLRAPAPRRSSSTTTCPTTSRGAGCSRPATRSARCCSSRASVEEAEAVYRADLGPGRHAQPALPAPRQRLEPARATTSA